MKLKEKRKINKEICYDISVKDTNCFFANGILVHNSNAAIIWTWNPLSFEYDFQTQSRTNIITPEKDNAGFAAFTYTSDTDGLLRLVMKAVGDNAGYTPEVIRLYGEWCGGNIQKGVAINGLDKMFVIFAVKIDEVWLTDDQLKDIKFSEKRIYNILDYPTYDIQIDFNNPKEASEKLAELTDIVEKECPVGKAFDKFGIGEGIVWRSIDKGWTSSKFWFKVKGELHQSSKTKEKVPIDIERVNNIKELVDNLVTESRLNQGLEHLRQEGLEMDRKNLGTFLKWINQDIIKEDLDTMMKNGFEPKEINGTISKKARDWFFEQELKNTGL